MHRSRRLAGPGKSLVWPAMLRLRPRGLETYNPAIVSTPLPFVGRVESVWRYPVKSMRGEDLARAFVGFAGVYGDRLYAFRSSAAPAGFPYLTAREQQQMLQCRVRFRHAERMIAPPNLAAAEALAPGATPLYGDAADTIVDVITPSGELFAVDDPRVIDSLCEGQREGLRLSLIRSERALTDSRPISIISRQTTRQLSDEVGVPLDPRRFRANIYVDLEAAPGFAENDWVGRRLRIGGKTEVAGPRARSAMQDDHPGSRDGRTQPRRDAVRREATRRDRRRLCGGPGGRHDPPGRPDCACRLARSLHEARMDTVISASSSSCASLSSRCDWRRRVPPVGPTVDTLLRSSQ